MITKECHTFWIRIYLSGPLEVIEQTCRKNCLRDGLCVNVQPTKYIYTGGEETGAVVELVNYPRFPSIMEELLKRAEALAKELLDATYQHSVMVMTPLSTYWITKREA